MKKIFTLSIAFVIALYSQAQFPLVPIYDVQTASPQNLANGIDTSDYYLDTVQVEGIVTFDPCDYGLSSTGSRIGTWLQDAVGGPWSAVHVLMDAAAIGYPGTLAQLDQDIQFIDNFAPGLKVRCTGIVTSFSGVTDPFPGNTQITLIPVASTITGLTTAINPEVLTVDQFMQSDGLGGQEIQYETGEQWEGVYVELQNIQVVDVSAGTGANTGRFFWSVQDAFGNKMKIRDVSGWIRNDTTDNFCTAVGSNTPYPFDIFPYQNATISFVRGTIVEFCSATTGCEFYISPLDTGDIGTITAAPPLVSNVQLSIAVPASSQSQTVSATVTDIDGTVASAELYYSIGLGNTTFSSVTMNQSGSTWSGVIPATGQDSVYVNYWIKATDNIGTYTNFPDSLATASFYWVINSGINSIMDIQYNPTGSPAPFLAGKWITSNMSLQGTIMATTGFYDLGYVTLQDGDGAWNGIYLRGQNLSTLLRGDKINITQAKVFENFNVTFLDSITYTLVSTGNALYDPHEGLNIDSVRLGAFNHTEPYEGVLLGFTNVYVVSKNPDGLSNFGEWAVDANTTDTLGLRCDDYSNDIGFTFNIDSFTANQNLGFIYGVLYYSFGNWKMLPRNRNDIEGYSAPDGIADITNPFSGINLFPNPATDAVTLRLNLAQRMNASVSVLDVNGRIMMKKEISFSEGNNEMTIQTVSWPSGIYFIQISNADWNYSGKLSVVN